MNNKKSLKSEQAYQYFLNRNYPEAIKMYESLMNDNPSLTENYWYLGLALLLQGEEDEASAIWLNGMMQQDCKNLDQLSQELSNILLEEIERREILKDYFVSFNLRQKIQELIPENLQNYLKINQIITQSNLSLNLYNSYFNLTVDDDITIRLNQIHSETTFAERKFLYNFFANIWSGNYNICEVGPFLGGTTRAIALGMLANVQLNPDVKLYTYDRFHSYYTDDNLLAVLQPLFNNKLLDESVKEKIKNKASFLEVFQEIHNSQAYSDLLICRNNALPQTPSEVNQNNQNLFKLDSNLKFDVAFIDGCKGWYPTKYFMLEFSQYAQVGSYYIFQDYLWRTCFWLPTFMYLMKDYFRLIFYVDHTYTFQLIKPLDQDVVNQLYPDEPQILGKEFFNQLFTELTNQASKRHDLPALVYHVLQHGAALAYIGYKEEAKQIIKSLVNQPLAKGYETLIYESLISPTYLPDQTPIYL